MRGNFRRILPKGVLLISILVVFVVASVGKASSEPVVKIDPKIITIAPGGSFEINLTVSDISNLYGWQFNVTFDPSVLNVTGVEEGPFLKQAGNTWPLPTTIDNIEGFVFLGDSLFPIPAEGATGNGTLATITFNVTTEGESILHFSESKLNGWDYDQEIPAPILHTAVDGVFIYPLLRDVAVTRVTASPTSVTAGELVSINVTVKNEGNITETFDVTVLYDSTTIETKTASDLASEATKTLSFSWDTTDVTEGDYTITAEVAPLSGETETADNTNSEVVVTVTAPTSIVIPLELLVGIIIVAVTVSAVTFLYIRGRKSTKTR